MPKLTFDKVWTDGRITKRYRFDKIEPGASLMRFETGERYVNTSHPYDLTDYHWAKSLDGRAWRIFNGQGYEVATLLGKATDALAQMRLLDRKLTPNMDRS
jgi:hypothetical protein